MRIDLNADLGEGIGNDAALLALITSANVCCGGYAGEPTVLVATLRAAKQAGVRIGAHPGFLDREYFGRRELSLPPDQVRAECVWQVGALAACADLVGVALEYIKPHGALYHAAMQHDSYAEAILETARRFGLGVMGLPNSRLAALAAGEVPFIREGFADRRYRADGSLVPRSEPDAFVETPAEAVAQIERLIRSGVTSICVHGDNPQALRFATAIRDALTNAGHQLTAVS